MGLGKNQSQSIVHKDLKKEAQIIILIHSGCKTKRLTRWNSCNISGI